MRNKTFISRSAGRLMTAAMVVQGSLTSTNGYAADAAEEQLIGVVHVTEIRIAPEIQGRVSSINVRAGQQVHAGDLIATLDTPELAASVLQAEAAAAEARAQRANVYAGIRKEQVDSSAESVEIAESNLGFARQQLERVTRLRVSNVSSQQALDESVAAVNSAEARLRSYQAVHDMNVAGPTKEERAIADAQVVLADAKVEDVKATLAKTLISAPVDGEVDILVASPGEIVSLGQPIVTLNVGHGTWSTFTVREDRLKGIAIGAPVNLAMATGQTFEGHVTELRPLDEFATWRAARAVGDYDLNSFLVRVDPSAPTENLSAGMTLWLKSKDD